MNPDDDWVIVGKIVGPHGVSGEVKVKSLSDLPARFQQNSVIFVESFPYKILISPKGHRESLILKLEGIDTREKAEALGQKLITVPQRDSPPSPEGGYYHYQLIGLTVHSIGGEYLGRISEILVTGSNDVYVVSYNDTELLVPALDSVITEVNIEKGSIIVDLPDGLR